MKEQKPPEKGRFYSFRAACRGAVGSKQKGISSSAELDLRLCLKNPRTFEKVRSKLFHSCCLLFFNKIKHLSNFADGEY
jgi:hypothetical protein